MSASARRCIASIDVGVMSSRGESTQIIKKIRVHDKLRALEALGRWKQMFVDRTEIGRPGEFERLSKMSDAELDAEEEKLRLEEERDRLASEQAAALISRASLPGHRMGGDDQADGS